MRVCNTKSNRARRRILEFLRIGYDVFISYARSDSQAYAQELFLGLSKNGFAPFIDAVATTPGKNTPKKVLRKLRHSSMLVIIGSAGSAKSINIKKEIELFAGTGRNIVLIDIDGASETAVWKLATIGLPIQSEGDESLRAGKPSKPVLDFILSSADFTKRSVKLQRSVISAGVVAFIFIAGGLIVSKLIIADAERRAQDFKLLSDARTFAVKAPFRAICSLALMSTLDEAPDAMQTAFEVLQRPKAIAAARLHSDTITHISFDPSDQWILSTSNDSRAVLWHWQTDEMIVLSEHESDIRLAARSMDGLWIMTADTTGVVKLRDALGKVLHSVPLNEWPLVGEFSHDGERLFIAAPNGSVRIWETDGFEELEPIFGLSGKVIAMALSSDGNHMLTGALDGTLILYNITEKPHEILRLSGAKVHFVSFSKSGQHFLVGRSNQLAEIHETKTGKLILQQSFAKSIQAGVFHPDNFEVAFGVQGGNLIRRSKLLSDVPNTQISDNSIFLSEEFSLDLQDIYRLKYNPDGSSLLVSGSGQEMMLIHGREAGHISKLRGHGPGILSTAFAKDGGLIATAASDGGVRVWALPFLDEPIVFNEHLIRVDAGTFFENGKYIATGDMFGQLKIWRADGQGKVWSWSVNKGKDQNSKRWIRSITVSSDDKKLVVTSDDGNIRIFAVNPYKLLQVFEPNNGRQIDASLNVDGSRLISVGRKFHRASLWNPIKPKAPIAWLKHDKHVNLARFTSDGSHVLTGSDDGTIRMWRSSDGIPVGFSFEVPGHSPVHDFVLSPDESRIAAVTFDGRVIMWRVADRTLLWTAVHDKGELLTIEFDPLGEQVLSGGSGLKAGLWRVTDGKHLAWLKGHAENDVYARFGSNGHRILTFSGTETLVWDRKKISTEPLRLKGHNEIIIDAMFSPAGDKVLTISIDRTARIWSLISKPKIKGLILDAAQFCR